MLERVWRKGNPLTLLVGMQLVQPLWRTVWKFLKILEIELPYYTAIPLLGIHTEETRIERNTLYIVQCSLQHFTIVRTWKQPRCLSVDEWIKKSCYIYTMEYSVQSVQFSRSVVSDSLRPHDSQHARPPCPSPTPGVHSDSRPWSQ